MKNIIFMEPIYKDYIWGGEKIKEKLNKMTPYDRTAESWEISSNTNGDCKILNKEFNNMTLSELFNNKKIKEEIFGTKCLNMKEFPLLIKFIDAKENLSIQVHPDDEYAKTIGQPNGKNEMWYIMDCEDDSKIVGGLKQSLTNSELKETINNNQIKNYLNYIHIKKGDSIYIPAGTLHAILKNNFICEIQQNSDITYRVYDWDRVDKNGVGRQLHREEAMDTIKSNSIPDIIHTDNDKVFQNIAKNKYFEVYKINCEEEYEDFSDKDSFYAINVVGGNGDIEIDNQKIHIKLGDSFIIPATLGKYKIRGKIEILKSYVI